MASEGLLTLPAGIALALGANIGTYVIALPAASGMPVEAVRASVVHISLNIVGLLIWLPFMTLLAAIAVDLSPVAGGLEETAKLAAMVRGLFETVRRRIELVVKAVGQSDQRAAQDVLLPKDEVRDFADRLFESHAQRLQIGDPKYIQRVRPLATFIEQLPNMYTLARRVPKTHCPPRLAQHEA